MVCPGQISPPRRLVGAAFGLGFIIGPIIAFIVLAASNQNYQAVAFTAAAFSLASIILTTFWFHETLSPDEDGSTSRRRAFDFRAMFEALGRPIIGLLLITMFFYQIAFGGYEQLFSLFTLTRLGMDARDTSGLFVLAGLFIVVVQGGFVGRWSKKYGDRWLVLMGISTLAIGLILTSLTPRVPVPWYNKARVEASIAGGSSASSLQNIHVTLPNEADKGWLGGVWLLLASFPAALGGGVLMPAINSMITQAADKSEVGGMLGISASFYSAANAIAPLFYGSLFQWLGSTTPFLLGGLILAALWLVAPKAIKKTKA